MITPIIIDTASIVENFSSITKEQIDDMLDSIAKNLAAGFAAKLEQNASQTLHQTKRRYINAIKLVDSGKLEGTVLLDYSKDKVVQMLEEGADAFDMKEYFLKSAKVKMGKKGGKYLTIPFRWATPNAKAESDVFSGKMPNAIYQVAKNKPVTIPVSGGGTRSAGISLKEIPEQFQIKKVRPVIKDNDGKKLFDAYQHQSSIYQGIVKQQDSATKQNTYHSFRRVSDKSDKDSWIHPGIERYNLIQKTLGDFNVEAEIGQQLTNGLQNLGLI